MTGPILERATPHECAAAHGANSGHLAGKSGSYTDCECGREWHWPVSEADHVMYLRDIKGTTGKPSEPRLRPTETQGNTKIEQ